MKRLVSEDEILAGEKVLKDVNFDRARGAVTVGTGCKMVINTVFHVNLSHTYPHIFSQLLVTQMLKDVEWLQENNVMDYSLLLGIHDPIKYDCITGVRRLTSIII